MKKLFKVLACCICSVALLNVSQAAADDRHSYDPPILPLPGGGASLYAATNGLDVLFLDSAVFDIEVVAAEGNTVYQANVSADEFSRLRIDFTGWEAGEYTVVIMVEGQLVLQKVFSIS